MCPPPTKAQSSNEAKPPQDSSVKMTELVLPQHANALGTVFGGTVMSWIDIAAAITAMRHARTTVVTASVDALHFIAPIRVGHIVHIMAKVNFVSRSSMEIGVRVDSEDPKTGEVRHTVSAYTTFVALDPAGKPTPVPGLLPQAPDEKRRFEEAKLRRDARMQLAAQVKKSRGN